MTDQSHIHSMPNELQQASARCAQLQRRLMRLGNSNEDNLNNIDSTEATDILKQLWGIFCEIRKI